MKRTSKQWLRNPDLYAGYAFIFPWLLGLFVFSLFPIFFSLYLSFTDYDILSAPQWIGFENFKEMFTDDPRFVKSVKVTLLYVAVSVPLRLCFALAVAALLNMKIKGARALRSLYYLPTLMGGSVAVIVMWGQLFGINGAFNSFMRSIFGIEISISWITDPSTALGSLIALSVWQFGSAMLIFLAGLKQIPASLLEAALVDGASAAYRFRRITLPLLSPVIFFNLVMGIIGGFKVFSEGMILTGGGPHDQTLFYVIYLYENSFRFLHMGYGSAMAWVLLLAVSILTALVFRSSSLWVHYESKGERGA
ncbi:carbohydrate ABC transporter permease [Paenibacillus luteus]|uniref:carbohydrate ABC transporter permease n=1 Tax=Paenibacillus luteus TaxID=2545753 RepID=UPI001143116D|nr:sugar ABC transporter permease [Paenibacillus luteus]